MSTLSDSPASLLQFVLIGEGAGVQPPAAPWPIYVGRLPDGSNIEDQAIAVYDTEPRQDGRLMAGEKIEHPGMQFRVRADDYQTGFQKLSAIAAILDSVKNQAVLGDSLNAYTVNAITRIGGVIPIGTDDQGREGFTLNVTSTITESP